MNHLHKRALLIASAAVALCLPACQDQERLPASITYNEHIAPVLNENCVGCHRPGGNAHFELTSYRQVKAYGPSIAYVVREHIMPPWPADPDYTEFIGQRRLKDYDIRLIDQWVKDGMPEGDAAAKPPPPDAVYTSLAGEPDLRLPVEPVFLEAGTDDRFLLVKVPFELPRDTFAALIEFVAGPRNVVHHVNGDMVKYLPGKKTDVFAGERLVDMEADTIGLRRAFERLGIPNDDGSYPVLQKSVVNYLPGVFGIKYPEGVGGYRLPQKGAFLLNDMHYGFSKEAVRDSSFIHIYFTKTPPKRPVQEFQLGTLGAPGSEVQPNLIIEPNTVKKVVSRFRVPEDISILTINPHMHLLGKSFKGYALKPNGDTIRLISIPRWDFNWQYFYTFKKMVHVPAGSTIVAEGVYDNTKENLNNPFSPPRLVRDQEGSMRATDEMFQFIITYLPYQPGDEHISLETP